MRWWHDETLGVNLDMVTHYSGTAPKGEAMSHYYGKVTPLNLLECKLERITESIEALKREMSADYVKPRELQKLNEKEDLEKIISLHRN